MSINALKRSGGGAWLVRKQFGCGAQGGSQTPDKYITEFKNTTLQHAR